MDSTTISQRSVLLSTIEMTSKRSKHRWNHSPAARGFTAKFWTFCVISTVDNSTDSESRASEKEKNKSHHHHAFPWSVLFPNIALEQSAREKSLSYCKNIFWLPVPGVISKPLVEFTGLLPRDPVPEPGDEALSDSYDPWGDDNMLVGLL